MSSRSSIPPSSDLPERASLEYLKKLAKERLRELRRSNPEARLATAQLAIARQHGFASWRALRAEVERRRVPALEAFFAACASGDVATLRELLDHDASLARARDGAGSTGLHLAARHPGAVRLLLERGADPNARDAGDHAIALHFAAGGGHLESVRALLDAGSDVHGAGDLHRLEVIGWATVFREVHHEVVDLLVERGAHHHIFSAIALADVDLIRRVVSDGSETLARRLSPFEQEQTALHYVIAPPDGLAAGRFRTGDHYHLLDALIEVGADLDARDAKDRTPLAVAMLHGDREAMRRLVAAGACDTEPTELTAADTPTETLASLRRSAGKLRPMLAVADIARTIDWYRAIGFELKASHEEGGRIDWASMSFGEAEIMFVPATAAHPPAAELSLWIDTDRIDDLYALLKRRQLEAARAALAGGPTGTTEIRFVVDLYTAFYGQREFGVRDPNEVTVYFAQPVREDD